MITQQRSMSDTPLTPLRRRHSSDDVSLFHPYDLDDGPQIPSPVGSLVNDYGERAMRQNSQVNSIVSSHRKRAVSQQRLPIQFGSSDAFGTPPQRPQPRRLGPERFDFLNRNNESPSRKSSLTPGSLREETKQPYRGPNYIEGWRASPSRPQRTWDLPRCDTSPDISRIGRPDSARDFSQRGRDIKQHPTTPSRPRGRPESPRAISSSEDSDEMEPDEDDPWSPFHDDKEGESAESFSHTIQTHQVPRRRLLSLPSNLQFPTDLRFTLSEFISKGITAPSMYSFPINPKSPPRK